MVNCNEKIKNDRRIITDLTIVSFQSLLLLIVDYIIFILLFNGNNYILLFQSFYNEIIIE